MKAERARVSCRSAFVRNAWRRFVGPPFRRRSLTSFVGQRDTLCASKLHKETRTVSGVHLLLRQGQRSCAGRGRSSAVLSGFATVSPSDDCDAGTGGIYFPSAGSGSFHHTAVDERADAEDAEVRRELVRDFWRRMTRMEPDRDLDSQGKRILSPGHPSRCPGLKEWPARNSRAFRRRPPWR